VEKNFKHPIILNSKCKRCGNHYDIKAQCHHCGKSAFLCGEDSDISKRNDNNEEIRITLKPSS
jgi:uncharacterized OB-fold protein